MSHFNDELIHLTDHKPLYTAVKNPVTIVQESNLSAFHLYLCISCITLKRRENGVANKTSMRNKQNAFYSVKKYFKEYKFHNKIIKKE